MSRPISWAISTFSLDNRPSSHSRPDNPWKPMKTHENPWKPMKTHENTWKPMKSPENPWKPMKTVADEATVLSSGQLAFTGKPTAGRRQETYEWGAASDKMMGKWWKIDRESIEHDINSWTIDQRLIL